jgi:hypothetical protein
MEQIGTTVVAEEVAFVLPDQLADQVEMEAADQVVFMAELLQLQVQPALAVVAVDPLREWVEMVALESS